MIHTTSHRALLFVSIIAVGLVASCNSLEIESTWSETPMVIDGLADDWRGINISYLEDNNASLGFANDSTRLYILMRFRDPRWASTIRRSGLTFWIDAEGGKSKDFRIRYRGGPTMEEIQSMSGAPSPRHIERRPEMMAPDTSLPLFTCLDEGRIVEMEIPTDGSLGPAAAFSLDEGFFTYEFSLPLDESSVRYYGLSVIPGQWVGIGAKWGEVGRQGGSIPDGPGGMGGRLPGGGGKGGGRGGGMSGGGRRGGGGQRPEMPEAQEVWLTTRLADLPQGE